MKTHLPRRLPLALLILAALCTVTWSVRSARRERESPSTQLSAQRQKETPATISRVQINPDVDAQLKKTFRDYEVLAPETARIDARLQHGGRLVLHTPAETLDLEVTRNNLLAPQYRAVEMIGGVARELNAPATLLTLAGVVRGRSDVSARFNVRGGDFEGLLILRGEKYFLEPLRRFSASAAREQLVLYREADVINQEEGACEVTLPEQVGRAAEKFADAAPLFHRGVDQALADGVPVSREIELATEADYEFTSAAGGSEAANAQILGVMNQVDGIYQSQLGLKFKITYQHTWADAADPYQKTAAGEALDEFRNYWNANLTSVNRDLAHMWSGKDFDGTTVGVAYLGTVCRSRQYAYGLSQGPPGQYWAVNLAAHEMGHGLNATHPDQETPPVPACSGSIMESQGGGPNEFCQFSRDQITTYVTNNSSCLTPLYRLSGNIQTPVLTSNTTVTITGGAQPIVLNPNDNGDYAVSGLNPGTYTVTPARPYYTFSPASQTITITNGDVNSVNFVGAPVGFSISGRVFDPYKNAAAGITFILSQQSGEEIARTVTDQGGYYAFLNVPATGYYMVRPVNNDYYSPLNRLINNLTADQVEQNFYDSIPPTPTPAPTPIPEPPPSTNAQDQIVFVENEINAATIYRANADGSNRFALTNAAYPYAHNPVWSPDGAKIAFTCSGTDPGLYVMDADGSNILRVVTLNTFRALAWSPDGKKIAISDLDGVQILNLADRQGVRISTDAEITSLNWSPDGAQLIYASGLAMTSQIWKMDADGGNKTQVTNTAGVNMFPRWSPNGNKIAFARGLNYDQTQIYVMNADGSLPVMITRGFVSSEPAWSPDSTQVMFTQFGNLYTVNADGSRITTNIKRGPFTYLTQPSWRPRPAAPPPGVTTLTLLTDVDTGRAAALDMVNRTVGPFAESSEYLGAIDQSTRIGLYVLNLELLPGENFSALTAEAEDVAGRKYPLVVEHAGTVPGLYWLTQVTIRVPGDWPGVDLQVSLTSHGVTSNQVTVGLK